MLLLLTLALPVRTWRTGELPAPPLPLVAGGPAVELPRRVWIDTDAACGYGRTTDPDDCLAVLLLATSPEVTVVGISTVGGNAPLAATDSITRALVARLPSSRAPPVYRGTAAHEALRAALAEGPLTAVALGPLTNLADALDGAPSRRANLGRIVAVMGRRPGHLFHPAEGAGGGMLFGHGPVFSDFNHAQDRRAAARVLALGLPMSLVPYEAAREVTLTAPALERIAASGAAARWVVARTRAWLDYWRTDIGRDGFYPFDLVGAGYVLRPDLFDCARALAWVGQDDRLWGWLRTSPALLVGNTAPEGERSAEVIYCENVRPGLTAWLVDALTSAPAGQGDPGWRGPSGSVRSEERAPGGTE